MTVAPISERDFQKLVTDLAEILGYEWAHFRPAQTARGWRTPVSGPLGQGFPDLVLIRRRDQRFLIAELKAEGAKPTKQQWGVLGAFEAAGISTYVWRPSDLERIQEVLR